MTEPEFLRPGEAAAALGVTTRVLLAWARAGKWPSGAVVITPGGHALYRRAAVEEMAEPQLLTFRQARRGTTR